MKAIKNLLSKDNYADTIGSVVFLGVLWIILNFVLTVIQNPSLLDRMG